LTVYGHYVSQPSRNVLWLLKIHEQPFNFVKIDVLKGEARADAYKSKFPTCLIPAIEDDGFCLAEGSAILQYLCEKHGWDKWWPTSQDNASLQERAKIAEFLSSHHGTTRLISRQIAIPLFTFRTITDDMKKENVKVANSVLKRFQNAFLREGGYVNGMQRPTIADLVAYSELGQLLHFDILPDFNDYPAVQHWAELMSAIPYYDDVHKSNL
ncbi:unnamed protein product, partial [Ectocarpus fasciculatus]